MQSVIGVKGKDVGVSIWILHKQFMIFTHRQKQFKTFHDVLSILSIISETAYEPTLIALICEAIPGILARDNNLT